MKFLSVVALCAALAGCGDKPNTPAQAMVAARATYIATSAAFLAYATQPFCTQPSAPKPPLCAKPELVIKGKAVASNARLALDAADLVINAGGIADLRVIEQANKEFRDLLEETKK